MVVLGQLGADLERKIEYFEVKEKEHIKLCCRQAPTLNNNNNKKFKKARFILNSWLQEDYV